MECWCCEEGADALNDEGVCAECARDLHLPAPVVVDHDEADFDPEEATPEPQLCELCFEREGARETPRVCSACIAQLRADGDDILLRALGVDDELAAKRNPVRMCSRCGKKPVKVKDSGLCGTCHQYEWRNKKPRPERLTRRQDELNYRATVRATPTAPGAPRRGRRRPDEFDPGITTVTRSEHDQRRP